MFVYPTSLSGSFKMQSEARLEKKTLKHWWPWMGMISSENHLFWTEYHLQKSLCFPQKNVIRAFRLEIYKLWRHFQVQSRLLHKLVYIHIWNVNLKLYKHEKQNTLWIFKIVKHVSTDNDHMFLLSLLSLISPAGFCLAHRLDFFIQSNYIYS